MDPSAAAELPADEITNSFDNNSGVLTVSPLHAEKYVLVSEALAKAAVQNLARAHDLRHRRPGRRHLRPRVRAKLRSQGISPAHDAAATSKR